MSRQPGIVFSEMDQRIAKNPYASFPQNFSTGYGEDAIMVKLQDGRQWQYVNGLESNSGMQY